MINTIIFDMGNVLIDFRWKALYEEMGLTGETFIRMAKATTQNPFWNEFDRGILTDEEMFEGFVKLDPELEPEIRRFFYEEFHGLLREYDYSREWIKSLKDNGYRVLLLSNFSRKALRECADQLGYMQEADGAVLSCDVKLIKPGEEIYKYLIEKYDVVPNEAVFIDDTAVNVEAAKKLGINGIVFENKQQAEDELRKLGVKI